MKLIIYSVFLSLVVSTFGAPQFKNVESMTPEKIAKILPVMKALLKVVETDNPTPEDMNTLFVLARDLQKLVPKSSNQFGVEVNFKELGLPETGNIIEIIDGEALIVTRFGGFPISGVQTLTNNERFQLFTKTKALINILEKDNLNIAELKKILEKSVELTTLVKDTFLGQFG